jgi:acyl-[acyl-carrier-protein] desaturase
MEGNEIGIEKACSLAFAICLQMAFGSYPINHQTLRAHTFLELLLSSTHQLLETGEAAWQPQDYLPDLTQDGWEDEIKLWRKQASAIPDELMIVLIGDMVTEEALPTYQTLLNTFEGCDDPTGNSDSPWARWSRGWTSEENRHGDLLNKYLYLTGRCDMRSIEVTIQHLITDGFNPGAEKDPYRGFVYTSFQERATKISHGNVGKLAKQAGDPALQRICAKISGDEGRHELAYQKFSEEILKRDPDGLIGVFGDMMRQQISMPAEQMTDGKNPNLYTDFSAIAQRTGVYTAIDYADIIDHLVKRWDIANIEGLSGETEKEREYICRLPERYRKLAERSANKKKKVTEDEVPMVAFDWVFGRAV